MAQRSKEAWRKWQSLPQVYRDDVRGLLASRQRAERHEATNIAGTATDQSYHQQMAAALEAVYEILTPGEER